MAPHSSPLAWRIPWTEEPGRLQSMGSLRVGHDWVTSLSLFTFMQWRRKCQPTPVFLPGESQDGVAQSGTSLKWLSSSSNTAGKIEQEFEPSSAELRASVPRNERQHNSVMKNIEFNVPNGDDGDGGGTDKVIIYQVLTAKQPARYQIIWYLKHLVDIVIIIMPIL